MARRRLTPNQREYNKQLGIIRGQIKRIQNLGYVVDVDEIIPPMPKRITKKSINEMKNIRTPEISRHAYYQSWSTGELISYEDVRDTFRQIGVAVNSPANYYDNYATTPQYNVEVPQIDIIESIRAIVESWPNMKYYSYGRAIDTTSIKSWALQLLSSPPSLQTITNLNDIAERLANYGSIITYASNQNVIQSALTAFANNLTEAYTTAGTEVVPANQSGIDDLSVYLDEWTDE